MTFGEIQNDLDVGPLRLQVHQEAWPGSLAAYEFHLEEGEQFDWGVG